MNSTAQPSAAPVAVVMITFNEAHNLPAVLENLRGWAQEVFVVDSYSTDGSVDVALAHGATVVQRAFRDFGDQWNFAVGKLPVTAPWTMKLDPDERLTDDKPIGLQESRWTDELAWIPPEGRAEGAAASTEDAFVQTIQPFALFRGLQALAFR